MPTHNTFLSGQRAFTLSPLTSSRVSTGVKSPRLRPACPQAPCPAKGLGEGGCPPAGPPALRASVKLQGPEREGEKRIHRKPGRPLSRPREAVFLLGADLTEALLALKVSQSWPRPWGSGLRVRGSPGGLGGAAAGSWALLRCPRLQSAARASGCRGGSQAFVRMTLSSSRPGRRPGTAWPLSTFLLSIYYAGHCSKSQNTVRANPYSPGIRM